MQENCNADLRAECLRHMAGKAMLRAVCNSNGCQRIRNHHSPSKRLQFAWDMYLLQEGGYEFRPNSLTVDEWKAIGELRIARRELERHG